jgi:hypothetical protein
MSLRRYAIPVGTDKWFVSGESETAFNWDYDSGRDRLLALYEKGKAKQWNAATLIDWSLDLDISDQDAFPDIYVPISGSDSFESMSREDKDVLRHHYVAWLFSQFLHGEQGALVCASKIVQTVPDVDSKFYAATQVMDEARHVAFGLLALQDAYRDLTEAERQEREEFVVEASYLLRNRFLGEEVWTNLGLDVAECVGYVERAQVMSMFRMNLFSRVVPTVKRIGLWGDKVQRAFEDMGVIAFESMEPADLFVNDERIANDLEAEIAARREQGPDAPPAATRDQELAEAIVAGEEG